jgi:serine/threonine-protein kinase RsbW
MNNDTKELILQSNFEEIKHLKPWLKELQKWVPFNDEQFFRIRLAVNEAVTNAIIHGNNRESSKKVAVKASKDKQTLQISIQDEGSGIDPGDLPNPHKKKNLFRESGRGLFLIKQYADEVSFYKEKSTLIMQFNLGD